MMCSKNILFVLSQGALCWLCALGNPHEVNFPPRIIDGYVPTDERAKYTVSLHRQEGTDWNHFCSGVAIQKDWILTAASCAFSFEKHNPKDIKILYGDFSIDSESMKSEGIQEIIVHPKFESKLNSQGFPEKVKNDIALIKLQKPVQIPFIDVNIFKRFEKRDLSMTTIGWGHKSVHDFEGSRKLLATDLTLKGAEACKLAWDKKGMNNFALGKYQLCSVSNNLLGSPCSGDTGGPLLYTDKRSGQQLLVGITSGGDCLTENANVPPNHEIFTIVRQYVKWMVKQVQKREANI